MTSNESPGLSVAEYARATCLSIDWIYRQVRAGKIEHVRLFGRVFITEATSRKGGRK